MASHNIDFRVSKARGDVSAAAAPQMRHPVIILRATAERNSRARWVLQKTVWHDFTDTCMCALATRGIKKKELLHFNGSSPAGIFLDAQEILLFGEDFQA